MFRLARSSCASLNVSSFGLRFGRQFSSQPLRHANRPFLLSHPPSTHLHPIRTVATPCLAISTRRHRHYTTSTSNGPPTTATFINGPLQPVDTATTPLLDPATTPLLDTVAQTPTSDAVVQTAMRVGDLNVMGLVHWTPVGALESFLEVVHVTTGLPWWGSIVATTLIIRIAMVPLLIKVQRNNARLANINPEVQSLMASLNEAKGKQDVAAMQQLAIDINGLFKSNECHPTKSLLFPIVQMPVMISFFMALRAMSELPVPQFKEGGLLWITDLTMKDPYYILPVVSCLSVLTIFEAGTEAGMASPQITKMKDFFRIMTVLMVPFTAWLPSSIFVYWVTSNAFSLGQILALKNERVRFFFNIPKHVRPATEPQTQSKDLGIIISVKNVKNKFTEQQEKGKEMSKERLLRERQIAEAFARRQMKKRF